jgi:hypothetical protein
VTDRFRAVLVGNLVHRIDPDIEGVIPGDTFQAVANAPLRVLKAVIGMDDLGGASAARANDSQRVVFQGRKAFDSAIV